MMKYNQVFDRAGKPLDIVLENTAPGWHCETVTSDGVGHNCTLSTSEDNDEDNSKGFVKVLSYIGPIDVNDSLYLTGNEEYLKDWTCAWVDSKGVGHDCEWVDIIVIDDE